MAFATVQSWSTTAADHTEINGIDINEACNPSGINNAIRDLMAQIATARANGQLTYFNYETTAIGATLDSTDRSKLIDVTAAVTIALDPAATLGAGWWCVIRANGGAVTVDPDATEQIDGATTLTISDGGFAIIVCDGTGFKSTGDISTDLSAYATLTGAETLTNKTLTTPTLTLKQSTGPTPTGEGDIQWDSDDNLIVIGDGSGQQVFGTMRGSHMIPLPAVVWSGKLTNGAAPYQFEETTNTDTIGWAFDAATEEYVDYCFAPPISFDESAGFTCVFRWTAYATGDCVWGIKMAVMSNDDSIDPAFGTGVTVTDSVTAIDDHMISAESGTITPGGTWTEGDTIKIRVYRAAANGSDTLGDDAILMQVDLYFTLAQELDG